MIETVYDPVDEQKVTTASIAPTKLLVVERGDTPPNEVFTNAVCGLVVIADSPFALSAPRKTPVRQTPLGAYFAPYILSLT